MKYEEISYLAEGVRELGLDQNKILKEKKRWAEYFYLLRKWGRRIALVSKKELGKGLIELALESLVLSLLIEKRSKVVDLGAGAGFPGIPLAIYRKDLSLVLIESVTKKGVFLKEVKRKLNLGNVNVKIGRWENFENIKASVIVSRATGIGQNVLSLMPQFLKKGGRAFIYASQPDSILPAFKVHKFRNPLNNRVFFILEYLYQVE